MSRITTLLTSVFALTACNIAGTPSADSCTVTLTGAMTMTTHCLVAIVSDGSKTAVTISMISTTPGFSGGVDLPAEILPQDYSTGTFSQWVGTTGVQVWNESLNHGGTDFPDKGDFLLHFSSVGDAIVAGTGKGHAHAHGTLHATLPADTKTGASGTVVADVIFTDSLGSFTSEGAGGGYGGGTASGGGTAAGGGTATGGGAATGGGDGTGGGGTGNGGSGGGSGSACTIALSGALTATIPCDPSAGQISTFTSYNFAPSSTWTGTINVACVVQFGATFTAGTFGPAAPVLLQTCLVSQNNAQEWASTFSASTQLGSFSFGLTNIGTFTSGVGAGFHGTYTGVATANTGTGAAGDLNFAITF